jgi:cell wall-associated NlpC family hydrolase
MRKEAAHRSEMTSQLLFGEFVEVLGEEKNFLHVKCLFDGYKGWCQRTQLEAITENEIVDTHYFAGSFQNEMLINNEPAIIPFGSPLYYLEMVAFKWGQYEVNYLNTKHNLLNAIPFSYENLKKISFTFLNTAYLWGGKSVFGIDCSGFVQQVFKVFGIKLLRDAYLQADQGIEIKNLSDAVPGDLVFFHNEESRITHVGIVLKNKEIIHASGKVRIDSIDEDGIITAEGERTHQLHSIRRFTNA